VIDSLWHGWLTTSSLAQRAAEALLRAAGRRHLARWDQRQPARCQRRILLGLLHQAQTTRFGRARDFRRIRNVADYRRLVPLSTRAELWRDYWQPVYPHLEGATWPGAAANGRLDSDDSARLTPPSPALQAAHRSALFSAFALAGHVRPRTRLVNGSLLFLADEGPSNRTAPALLAERLPAFIHPFTEASADFRVERWATRSVSVLLGPVERLLSLMEQIKQARGKRRVRDVWPNLAAILYTRRPGATPAAVRLRAEAGDDVLLLEMAGRAEGPIAVEDPRFGLPRLLFDHGVYFEFVPPSQVGEPRCPRFGVDEIELGAPYELAVTSPAGLWACRLGRTVCLEQRDPPLLRFLETPTASIETPTPRRTDLAVGALTQPRSPELHPGSDGIPATPSENVFHSPWSARADRE
jgi:hypothetical protein